ncbi:hypothetical protein JTB14_015027 [Gonioctena quinquepunctata]|nr:hypothetical protein JTB14_015027 [Gonioctena quinquepunctata]
MDEDLEVQLQSSQYSLTTTPPSTAVRDSIVSVYVPITPDQPDPTHSHVRKKKKRGKSKSSSEKSSSGKSDKKKKKKKKKNKKKKKGKSTSGTSSSGKTVTTSVTTVDYDPVVFGMCTIDLLPFFYGKKSFSETISISPLRKHAEEKMVAYDSHPKIAITVSLEGELVCVGTGMMNFTAETIYNLPALMTPEAEYSICAMIPIDVKGKQAMLLTNPKYTLNVNSEDSYRCWPGLSVLGFNANTTKYRVSTDNEDIFHKFKDDILPYFDEHKPKLEFNMIKRNFFSKDAMDYLFTHIKSYHNMVLEVYMIRKTLKKKPSTLSGVAKGRKDKKSSTSKSATEKSSEAKKTKRPFFLHLMAILDLSLFLYPGVSRVRLASPLKTFCQEEALRLGGLKESYFSPAVTKDESKVEKKMGRKKKRKGKKSTESSKSSKKSNEVFDKDSEKNPTEDKPEIPEGIPVLNELGKPCFIVVEIEFSKPLVPKHDEEDVKERLDELLKKTKHFPTKIVCPKEDSFKTLLDNIIQDMNVKFQKFLEENPNHIVRFRKTPHDFVEFLQSSGCYQTYLNAISEVMPKLLRSRFQNNEQTEMNIKDRQNFISDVFSHLMAETNDTLNKLVSRGMEPACIGGVTKIHFFYAKEATEMGNFALADRFLLERICSDTKNPNYLFDYAIYFLEIGNIERAYDCLKEALLINPKHRHSLMAFGILLEENGEKGEAECCFLMMTILNPRWVEGWIVLHMFYKKYGYHEGMDVTLCTARKYSDDKRIDTDYFTQFEDLAWCYTICPKTLFFRTAVLLLKMRFYDWSETVIAEEPNEHNGLVGYFLSVIRYYKGMYHEALELVEKMKKNYGCNYAFASLSGHCLFALGKFEEAKQDYYHAIGYENRPDDLHLVYLNYSDICRNMGDYQEAIKLLLLACKYNPTAYTWLKTGLLYFW